jgi:hypothetical protein
MTDTGGSTLDAASAQAEHYAQLAMTGDFERLWNAADDSLHELADAGYAPEEFLPFDDQVGLGFAVPGAARAFYRVYIKNVRRSLCTEKGELRAQLKSALSSGAGVGTMFLASVLAVPAAAAVILAPIVGIMLALGVDTFCEASELAS